MSDMQRDPCPDRIIQDAGAAFGMGAIGGSAFHFLKGLYNSPRGERFIGGAQAVRMNAPRVGGSFAVWGGLFSMFDCAFVYARQKEDPWNSILAGGATGGLLSLRQGFGPMGSAILGSAALLALLEGAGIMQTKLAAAQQMMPPAIFEDATGAPEIGDQAQQGAAPSWLGGLFGAKKEEVKSYVKDEVLESFDSPMPPTFDFK